jgi:hypothetical protein
MDEYLEESSYLDFAKEFNKGHIRWLSNHDADERFAAFAAYERLDNIDYNYLFELASNLGTSKKGLIFFKVHTVVTHFQSTEEKLLKIWSNNPQKVENAFNFIASHQINMWYKLSELINQS